MTPPREPDRYEARAAKIIGWVAGVPGYLAIHKVLLPVIADCLRSAEASALERAAQEVERVDPRETITREEARVITRRAKAIRALAPSPESPPAKEETHAFDPSWFNDISQSEYCEHCGKTRAEHVPSYSPFAPGPSAAEKRIAELEELLRECEEVLRAAKQADNAWFSGAFYDQLDRVIRRLAARTASPGKGEG